MTSRTLRLLTLLCLVAAGCGTVPTITPTQQATVSPADENTATNVGVSVQAPDSEPATPAMPDIPRHEAIDQLADAAFLSYKDAACVIDALHQQVGVYNFMSEQAAERADQSALIEMCANGGPMPPLRSAAPQPAPASSVPGEEAMEDAAPTSQTMQVLVVADVIPQGTTVRELVAAPTVYLTARAVPDQFVDSSAIDSVAALEEFNGMVLTVEAVPGEQLLRTMFGLAEDVAVSPPADG